MRERFAQITRDLNQNTSNSQLNCGLEVHSDVTHLEFPVTRSSHHGCARSILGVIVPVSFTYTWCFLMDSVAQWRYVLVECGILIVDRIQMLEVCDELCFELCHRRELYLILNYALLRLFIKVLIND